MKVRFLMTATFCLLAVNVFANSDSLYDKKSYKPLGRDKISYKTDDIVTVVIEEALAAKANQKRGSQRNSNVSVNLGRDEFSYGAGTGTDSEFQGSGEVSKSGYLSASVSARIVKEFPNGDLWIVGSQEIELDGENQSVFVQGRVRPTDINSSNAIDSTRLAEATIRIKTNGTVTNNQKPGTLNQIFDWIF